MKTLDYFRNRLHNKTCKNNFGGFKNESELEKDFNGRYPFKCFRGFTYCLWWRRKTKAENESGSANKAAGDVKLWVDTEYMGVFKSCRRF